MGFVEMSAAEWDAVYKHHDAMVRRAELELKAERIREDAPAANQGALLEPIEVQMHDLDDVIASLPA